MNGTPLLHVSRALRRLKTTMCVALTALGLAAAGSASALIINLTYDPDTTFTNAGLSAGDIVNMKAASAYAAALLTTNFTDNISVNIRITAVPGTGILGVSSNVLTLATNFATLRTRLLAEASTADDVTATSAGGSIPVSDPFGGSTNFVVTRAQAKSLGIFADDAVTLDGTFTFGGGHSYTYDPANRAVTRKFDFIGLALREFSEIMGRRALMGGDAEGSPGYMLMDLFHFSAPGTPAFNTGAGRYFSIDNGTNNLKAFNDFDLNGGDAHDWASGTNDAFNALSSSNVLNNLTEVDLRVMDVIGYNRLTLPAALDSTNLVWTTGGNAGWFPQTALTHDGVDAARSGPISGSQTSYVQTVISGPVTLSFWWKVSSEANFDFLRVAVDGNNSNSISGEVNWQLISLALPAGAHTVRWSYTKDAAGDAGANAAWLDQVTVAVAPVLANLEAAALAYTENQAATNITASLTVADADSVTLTSATVSITTNFASGQDVLAMSPSPQNGITATYNTGTGVLSLSGASSLANYETALRSVTYTNTSENPSNTTRTVRFLVSDGTANSNPQIRDLSVSGVNDAPVLATIEAGTLAYTENQAAVIVSATIGVADADNVNLAGGTVSLTTNFVSGQDVLAMSPNPQNGIAASYDAGLGVLTLTGSATVVNYRTALRSVRYSNTNDTPSTATRSVTFVVNDGATNSNPQTRNISVAAANDAPVLGNIEAGALGYSVNQAATLVTATLTAGDVDSTNLTSGSVSITANFASGQDVLGMSPNPQNGITAVYNAGTGVLSLSGTSAVSNYQAALRSVTYVNSSGSPSTLTRTVTFLVNDGALPSNPQARSISVSGETILTPNTPTNGGIASILLFVPDTNAPSSFQSALNTAGLSYQLFTNASSFNAVVLTSAPSSTLVIADVITGSPDFSALISFVANGGRAILYLAELDQNAALGAAFNVATVQDITTPVAVNNWGGSYFFTGVSAPLNLFERGTGDDGDKLQPTPGGVAVAGHSAAPAFGQACVVIGNSGRTIVNSMALQDATTAQAQAAQFALNEIFYLLAPFHGGGRVAVLGAEVGTGWNEDVRQKLLSSAAFESVEVFQADVVTPTLTQLQNYSAVLVYSDVPFQNSTNLGNVLADYVDAGGGVVVATFALFNSGSRYGIDGRLLTGGYLPFVAGGTLSGNEVTLVPDEASHPILAGVGALNGGTSSYHNEAAVAANAALVAHWSDGRPLVMTKITGLGRVVGLNFFPVSQTVSANLWRTNTAGGRLMANALQWAALPECALQTNYTANMTFTNAGLDDHAMALAFDGTNFWAASGGFTTGQRLARYTAAGVLSGSFAPGLDFSSLFTDAGGRLYARAIASSNILRQTTPGNFVTHVVLSGGFLDDQSSVVLNGSANEYVALIYGAINRWSTNGTFLGTTPLTGFGDLAGENVDSQNVRLAAAGKVWITYNANRVLSVWSQSGSRMATTVLQNAGTASLEAQFSVSCCAGKVFVCDGTGGLWRGYDICTSPEQPTFSNPVRFAGGPFHFDLHAPPARNYTLDRSSDFITWVPFTNFVPLAPNTAITDTAAVGQTNLFYRARTP